MNIMPFNTNPLQDFPLISVVVCTHNRVDLLTNVLQSICNQTLAMGMYEIIIVDNNSTDNTAEIVKAFSAQYTNVYYYHESKIGLSHARNRGWQEAKGSYVAYIDDDAKAPEQWLSLAMRIIQEHQPAAFGGPFYAFYNTLKPKWFKDEYESDVLYTKAQVMNENRGNLRGSNMFFRSEVLEQLGGFDPNLGMTGEIIAYGEESALQKQMKAKMPTAIRYYDPELYVYHLVRPEKMRLGWQFVRAQLSKGYYTDLTLRNGQQRAAPPWIYLLRASKLLSLIIFDLLCNIWLRKRVQYPYWQNYVYEHTARYIRGLGALYSQFTSVKPAKRSNRLQKVMS